MLKPKLGDDWKEYTRWFMTPVWLENVLSHQPPQWLPAGYANYDELLTAAVEAAVTDSKTPQVAQPLDLGPRPPDRREASVLEQLPHPQAGRRSRAAAAVRRWR